MIMSFFSEQMMKAKMVTVKTLTVCYYHITYVFQGESTLYNFLNFKEIFAWNRRDIWSLSDSNEIRIQNNLVCKRTLNHLAKLAKWLH